MGKRLTTAEAEKKSGATRWRLMRAQKNGELLGFRDNKNRWSWDEESLDEWSAQSAKRVRTHIDKETKTDTSGALVEALERAARAEGELAGTRIALDEVKASYVREQERADRAEAELRRIQARRWWGIFARE